MAGSLPSPYHPGSEEGDGTLGGQDPEAVQLAKLPIFVSFCSKDASAFMVNPLTAQGVTVVVVGYAIAPKGN